eukprot:m.351770 g.351770  ORF g.351770 m.351770 type:complete len:208 (+) comp16343_c0_seq1:315-938(+)
MAKKGSHLCFHVLYSFFLFLSALFVLLAAVFPSWIVGYRTNGATVDTNERNTCGFFVYCQSDSSLSCPNYEFVIPKMSNLPILAWQISFGFLAVSAVITWLSFIVSLVTCCFCYSCTKAQIPALTACTIFLFISLIAFGYGLGDVSTSNRPDVIKCDCGVSASRFKTGECDLGYGGGVTIVACLLCAITIGLANKVKKMDLEAGMIA